MKTATQAMSQRGNYKGVNGSDVRATLKTGPYSGIFTWKKQKPKQSQKTLRTIGKRSKANTCNPVTIVIFARLGLRYVNKEDKESFWNKISLTEII